MAKIYNKNALLSVLISEANLSADLKLTWQNKIKEWNLGQWEDNMLFQLLVSSGNYDEEELKYADELINILRGNDLSITPYSTSEIKSLVIDGTFLANENNYKKMLRTIYFGMNLGEGYLSFQLRIKLDPIINGQVEIKNLPVEYFVELSVIYLMTICNYFVMQPIEVQRYVFISYLLPLSLDIGIDWENVIKDSVQTMTSFDDRRNLCLDLAAALDQNDSELGKKPDGTVANISYWVEMGRVYTQSKFDGVGMMKFINDAAYMVNCIGKEKMNIQKIIQLYAHLINGFLILPEVDMDSFINSVKDEEENADDFTFKKVGSVENSTLKIEDVKRLINNKFKKDDSGDYVDIEGVLSELQKLSVRYKNPDILEFLYFDDQDGKFKWSV